MLISTAGYNPWSVGFFFFFQLWNGLPWTFPFSDCDLFIIEVTMIQLARALGRNASSDLSLAHSPAWMWPRAAVDLWSWFF